MSPETFSFSHLHGLITAAGLASFLQYPLAIDGPALLRDYAAGRIRIDPGPAAAQREQPQILRNDLRLLTVGQQTVAIQPVTGVIYSGVSPQQEEYHGLFNTDRIHHTAAAVQTNPAVKMLLINFDTPGGSVMGLRSAADALLGLKSARPDVALVGYSQRLCASAGMYLAAALDQFHTSPGAYIGSIGTVAELSSWKGFQEKLGIDKRVYTADYTLKGMGRTAITPEQDAHMQALVKTYSDEFNGWMLARRGLQPDAMQGQAWEARLAPAGMADSTVFTTVEQFLATALGL